MPRFSLLPSVLATSLLAASLALPALAQPTEPLTRDNAISGQVVADFASLRSRDAQDQYRINLNVADYVSFDGTAQRQPGRSIEYNIRLLAHNPNSPDQSRHVGQLKGVVAIDDTGQYLLRGSDRLRIDPAQRLMVSMLVTPRGMAQDNPYDGVIQGKAPKATGLLARLRQTVEQVKEYTRTVGGQTITVSVENPDILEFRNVKLGAGPWPELTEVTVNGNLDYDYASGNWITEGIRMNYLRNEQPAEDVITGTIRWVDEEGSVNLKGQDRAYTGYYEFNLRFNEGDFATDAASAFFDDSASEEDVFFAEDNRIPGLLGRAYFNDSRFIGSGDEETATHSEISYAINANKLSPVQLANFTKLWLLGIGPIHDD